MPTNIDINSYIYSIPNKGNMSWEYNPFRNYQVGVDVYKWKDFLIPKGSAINIKNGQLLTRKGNDWIDNRGNIIPVSDVQTAENSELYAKAGSLLDLDTHKLNFDLSHPVDIQIQPSYDGSVNLILNDDKNTPKLINSRFSVREKNTYEIVDRIGENDTNIYNSESFEKDTSLYFQYESNPIINYRGYVSGVLPVGQYCFYLTYCDSDDNESDYIAESGLIPVFIGSDGNPESIDGGIKNQMSNKGIRLKISNLDNSYNYLKIYYVRYFADLNQNRVSECKKLIRKYPIDSNVLYLQITGNEDYENIDPNILNITRFNPKSVLTSAQCKNMLFFGNIVKNTDNYKELSDISLRIIPKLIKDNISLPDQSYQTNSGYYSSENIYLKTGYFDQEYYRFGIVYIYQNGTLSNVYNTLGLKLNETDSILTKNESIFNSDNILLTRKYINIDDFGWIKNPENFFKKSLELTDSSFSSFYLNSKGVCKIDSDSIDNNTILGIQFTIPEEVKKYLKEELGIRGFFFVRQKCIPNILAQCYLLPMDDVLEAPVIESYQDNKFEYYTECFLTQATGSSYDSKKGRNVPTGDRYIRNDYNSRLYKFKNKDGKSSISEYAYAAICPDFLLNQPYYNQFFNGSKFKFQKISVKEDDTNVVGSYLTKDGRFYNVKDDITIKYDSVLSEVKISSVTESVPTVAIKDKIYRSIIGKAEEAFRFRYVELDNGTYDAGTKVKNQNKGNSITEIVDEATNLVRGVYSPYLAIYSDQKLDTSCLYNIYQDTYNPNNLKDQFQIRMDSSEPFYAISDRYNFSQLNSNNSLTCWRGDCYINNFTYRLNRNFQDPTLPNNDVIIDQNTWRNNYKVSDPTKWEDISRADINAIQMGSWINFKLRSSMNYSLRSLDHSYTSEEALMGSPRSFYPKNFLMYKGENKIPDSYVYNDAYRASLGFKCYFTLDNINYLKNVFSNRIQYSAISVQDSYKNNYRYSLSTYFRDYSSEYGSITKLIGFEGYLLVVFEHAVAIAVINERILQGQGDGEPVFINTKNVLPEELTIISDTLGSQWTESVIKSESGYVYGVDTIAKKIWRVKGQQLDIISDLKVNKFLVDNITFGEQELNPIIGIKNIKTHYNNNKKDIMFTFYDDVYKDEEKVWNLCYNELMEQFITFYSWIPSYSENIDTQYFTFNRDTSKKLALLQKSNYNIPENSGILLDPPIQMFNDHKTLQVEEDLTNFEYETYIDYDQIEWLKFKVEEDWEIRLTSDEADSDRSIRYYNQYPSPSDKISDFPYIQSNVIYTYPNVQYIFITPDDYNKYDRYIFVKHYTYDIQYPIKYIHKIFGNISNNVSYILEKDHYHNYELFEIVETNEGQNLKVKVDKIKEFINKIKEQKVLLLYLTPVLEEEGLSEEYKTIKSSQYFTTECVALTTSDVVEDNNSIDNPLLTTDFFIHGRSGIFDIKSDIKPCYWYGTQHPFEFEFVVNASLGVQKIFNNLMIISNKAKPESFHFEIEGDNYMFSKDKLNMYYRQENTKHIYQNLGSDVIYNRNVEKLKNSLNQNKVSTIFPLYYNRIDTFNEIYHKYQLMSKDSNIVDYQNLSGSEIVWNPDLQQFNIITHIKNSPITEVGRIRGNSYYKEGIWNIQIPSIIFNQKEESAWENNVPPLILSYIPTDIKRTIITGEELPNTYEDLSQIQTNEWTFRKEAKIRDKWIKIRIRYTGEELAIIHSIITLFNLSYA